MRVCQCARLQLLVGRQLIERIEWQELDAGARVDLLARDDRADLLHDTVDAVIPIAVWLTHEKPRAIHQPVIDGPGVHANAVELTGELPCAAQAHQRLFPQRQDVPDAVPADEHGTIGEAMDLLKRDVCAIEAGEDDTSALRTEIDRRQIARRHGMPR